MYNGGENNIWSVYDGLTDISDIYLPQHDESIGYIVGMVLWRVGGICSAGSEC